MLLKCALMLFKIFGKALNFTSVLSYVRKSIYVCILRNFLKIVNLFHFYLKLLSLCVCFY